MNRIEFTKNICSLIMDMINEGEQPIIDYCKRSDEEQARLFKIGRDEDGNIIGKTVTNCDGIIKISSHQRGKGIDILFLSDDGSEVVSPKKGWNYWHQRWSEKGGADPIPWDMGHFD